MTAMEMYMKMRINALKCKAINCEEKTQVIVQLGRCSQAVGAKDVLAALEKTVIEENIKNVNVGITGCMGLCSYEPIVTIIKTGKKPVTYYRVTPEMARVLLSEYIRRENIIRPWTLDREGIVL